MALTPTQAAEVSLLRQMTDLADGTDPYTDEKMLEHVTREGSVEQAAAYLWRVKAASFANLVDMTEGASSRKLSQLHEHALTMAAKLDTEANAGGRPTRINTITRD